MHAFSRLGQLLDPDKWSFTLTIDASGDIDVISKVEFEPYWEVGRKLARDRPLELLFKGHSTGCFN